MIERRRLRRLQLVVAAIWIAAFLFTVHWLFVSGVHPRHWPKLFAATVRAYGYFGPLIILGLYLLRSIFFLVPTSILTFVTGTLYGPFWGLLLNVLGENLTTSVSFVLGRILGRRFVRENEGQWLRSYDDLLRREGFLAILFMRLLYFPFDLVNYGSGMSSILYRQYAVGTFLGLLPGIVVLTLLGDSFRNPKTLILFCALTLLTLAAAFFARRSAWVKRKLYPIHVHDRI